MKALRNLALLLFVAIAAVLLLEPAQFDGPRPVANASHGTDAILADAFERRRGDLQVEGRGVVARVLRDDLRGDKHQRFIVRLASGQELLVAHNIDLAPRVADLQPGDTIEFFGEYEWNDLGGVIHWTHHDPRGRHPDGWLRHAGRTYQ